MKKTHLYILIGAGVALLLALVVIVAFVAMTIDEDPARAQARIVNAMIVFNIGSTTIQGTLLLTQNTSSLPVEIDGLIKGFSPNSIHGFHVHEFGNVTNGCASTGSHFNPYNVTHGGPSNSTRHVGDLGNIVADENGIAHVQLEDSKISLSGPHSIIGRAFVIHELEDDLGSVGDEGSLTTGNAGARLVCGIVGVVQNGNKNMP